MEKRVFFVTGSIASGKSSFMKEAAKRGFECLSADKIAHQILENHPLEIAKILENDSFLKDGKIERKALGELVFKDKSLKKRLENFMHPKIREFIVEKIENFKKNSQNLSENSTSLSDFKDENFINLSDFKGENSQNLNQNKGEYMRNNALFIELPLFFETKNYFGLGKSILIYLPAKIALKRLMARNKLTYAEAILRQKAQLDIEKKREMADFVIENFTKKAFKTACAEFFATQNLA